MARSDRVRLNGDRVKAAASPPSWALGANAIFGRVASESPGWCGRTVVLAGWDGQARGAVAVADTVKPSAAAAVVELRRLGLRTVLLTGDSQLTAQAVAAGAGTDEVIAGALPDYKWPSSGICRPAAAGWPWSATGSTTGPPWPPPTSGWPWAPAPTWRSLPPT